MSGICHLISGLPSFPNALLMAKRVGSEEASSGGKRRGVRGLNDDMVFRINQLDLLLRICAPEHEDDGAAAAVVETADRSYR
jgi:hypothetical protein